MFINVIWPLVLICGSGIPTTTALLNGSLAMKLHTYITPFTWLALTLYLLIISRNNVFLLGVSLLQFVLHSLWLGKGKDSIMLSSTSFVIITCMNMWGSVEFELIALTLLVEIFTWIVTYFLLTIATQ